MATMAFHELNVYKAAEELCDAIWKIVHSWNSLDRDTVGKQIIRSADSIGANIAEGNGRGTAADNRRFVRMARGSFNETRHWLRRAYVRQLLNAEQSKTLQDLVAKLGPLINGLLRSIERSSTNRNNVAILPDPPNNK
jgi:four helix bundle protein